MKHAIIFCFFIFLSILFNGQTITVKLDTCQHFEHSVLLSTTQATDCGKLVYKNLYENKPNIVAIFDLPNMVQTFGKYTYDIIRINKSSNIIDIVVNDNGHECLIILGKTEKGGMIYIFEYRDGDLIKGFFSKNPEIIYNK